MLLLFCSLSAMVQCCKKGSTAVGFIQLKVIIAILAIYYKILSFVFSPSKTTTLKMDETAF